MKNTFKWLSVSVVFWTAIAVVFALPQLGLHKPFQRTLVLALAQWWSWGLLVPVVVALDRVLPFRVHRILPRVLTLFLLGPLVTILYGYVEAILRALLGVGAWSRLFGLGILTEDLREMFWSMLVYCLIVGVFESYRYHQLLVSAELQMERLQRNFSEARLNVLRMQLDPHFLFNALNTVSSQVEREPRLARKMIEHLGDLLRLSLNSLGEQVTTLGEEVAFLDHYLAIQKIRFGDVLKIDVSVAQEAKDLLVPSLFLQPLVENAIRHGISKRASGGSIVVIAHAADQSLLIQVLDDGVGLPPGWSLETHKGVGLSVTRERFAAMYPSDASRFDVRRRPEGGTEVSIALPMQRRRVTDEVSSV